jgi:hypothetical protein
MPTEAQQNLAAFYDEIVRRAYSGACNRWCQTEPDLQPNDGGVTLVPRGYVAPEWIEQWPTLATAPGDFPEPAFVLDRYAVEQALTAILKLTSTIDISPGGAMTRRHLHIAEQEADARVLSDPHVDLIVQVAVFGRVVFDL